MPTCVTVVWPVNITWYVYWIGVFIYLVIGLLYCVTVAENCSKYTFRFYACNDCDKYLKFRKEVMSLSLCCNFYINFYHSDYVSVFFILFFNVFIAIFILWTISVVLGKFIKGV